MRQIIKNSLRLLLGIFFLQIGAAGAVQQPEVGLALENATILFEGKYPVYLLSDPGQTDPVSAVLTITNEGTTDILTPATFPELDFANLLLITRPDNRIIKSNELTNTAVPDPEAPPVFYQGLGGQPIQGEPVVIIPLNPNHPADAEPYLTVKFNIRELYTLPLAGYYTAYALVPFKELSGPVVTDTNNNEYVPLGAATIFSGELVSGPPTQFILVGDADGDGYCYPVPDSRLCPDQLTDVDCDDGNAAINPGTPEINDNGIDDDCDPGTLDPTEITPAELNIRAITHIVGPGVLPDASKLPKVDLNVRVFDKSEGTCASKIGVSWRDYLNIWRSCEPSDGIYDHVTDENGLLTIYLMPGEYVIIGESEPDAVYLGSSLGPVAAGEIANKNLQELVKADNKTVAAKGRKFTGSELWIIEPEYVEWDGTEEFYPFVFDSVGDWTVSTSVTPPEGFVADNDTLSEEVNNEIEAVQFTITDIGSDWVDTDVLYEIKHKNKIQKVKSKIGVKLSKKLAKKKNLSEYGHYVKPGKKLKDEKTGKAD